MTLSANADSRTRGTGEMIRGRGNKIGREYEKLNDHKVHVEKMINQLGWFVGNQITCIHMSLKQNMEQEGKEEGWGERE